MIKMSFGGLVKKTVLGSFTVNDRVIEPTMVTIHIDGELNYLLEKYILRVGGNKRNKCHDLIKKQLLLLEKLDQR